MRPKSTIAMVAAATLIPATIYAQSPPPAQLAPGSSGSAIAPQSQAPSPQPRSSIPDAAPGGNTVQAPTTPVPPSTTGAQPSAPSAPRR
jgi:hypothetical protein